MSWYKCSNGRITERKLQNNVRSPSYDNYDSLVILVSPFPLQCCLPASPPPQPPPFSSKRASLIFLWPDTLAEHLELYIVYRLSISQPKDHLKRMQDFYLWHGNSNNFHMPCSLSYFTYLRYVPNSIELCHGFIKCHTWRWYWLDIIVKRPKWRSLPRRNGSFKRIHVKLYTI